MVPAGGQRPGSPLLVLHGGPGAGHDYLETLEALADERPVIFYDQLGCGRSDKPDDPSRWHIGRFVREVDLVRQALGLDRIHLLGQSWGGWLAVEYMLGQPAGIESLILASTSASIPQFVAECDGSRVSCRRTSTRLCRSTRRPRTTATRPTRRPQRSSTSDTSADSGRGPIRTCGRSRTWTDNQVYETMNGPNEFMVIGNLRTWDRIGRLGEIRARTLITVGRYDELSPTCAETLRQGIAGSRGAVRAQFTHGAPGGDGRVPGRRPGVPGRGGRRR